MKDGRDPSGRFAKGFSGNPAGPPRRSERLQDILHRYGSRRDPRTGRRRYDLLAQRLWDAALHGGKDGLGDRESIVYIIDRVLGRPKVQVEHEGQAPMPMIIGLPLPASERIALEEPAWDAERPPALLNEAEPLA